VRIIRQIYRERRDVMLQALEEFFPPTVTWTHPQGGLFLWVTLPHGLDMKAVFNSALEQNVAFVPGDSFYASGGRGNDGHSNDGRKGSRHMRLNFSNAAPPDIREGIRRLSIALKSHLPASTLRPALALELK
jgi:2-aminoadipate transaminase